MAVLVYAKHDNATLNHATAKTVTAAKGLGGDPFLPANYKKDWELVRQVAVSAGQSLSRAGYDAERAKKK